MTRAESHWASPASAATALTYLREHERGQRALLWAIAEIRPWQEAYESAYAYIAFRCGVDAPRLTFQGDKGE